MSLKLKFVWAARAALLSSAVVALAACGGSGSDPAFTMQLLHVSDADGSDQTTLNSVANLSGMVTKFKADYPNNTLVLSSGDNYIPGPRFNAANDTSLNALLGAAEVGRGDIAFLNAIGVQASAIGNHELDLGPKQFADLIKTSGAWKGAQFPYLAYNVDFTKDSNTSGSKVANGLDASGLTGGKLAGWTKIVVAGETIGVIGASSPVFKNITTTGSLEFTPTLTGTEPNIDTLAAEIQKGVDEMTAAGINKVVLLAHMQTISLEKALATKLKNVDIIVAGGSNTLLTDENDSVRVGDTSAGVYPFQATSASGAPVVVVNVDADYKYLGRFIAPFDANGVLLPGRFNTTLSGAWKTSETDDTAGGVTPNSTVQAIRDALKNVLLTKDGTVFGKTSVFMEGRRSFVRNQETNFGNMTADANLWYAKLYDTTALISLKNGGGIRSEIGEVVAAPGSTSVASLEPPKANTSANRKAGEVSQLAIETALKFNNKLWVFDVTAIELKSLLEHGVATLGSQGRFPQVGGMAFSYDSTKTAQVLDSSFLVTTAGERIRSLKVGSEEVVRNGAIVGVGTRTFRLVTLSFLAGRGDGYPFPATLTNKTDLAATMTSATAGGAASTSTATLGSEQDAFMKYMKSQYGTTAYNTPDTAEAADLRIQNLSKRTDTVLP
ncbi:MAG: bifunctional metallophosphatase/5'-nucleotidase [Rhodoferax sp.]|nr:bifunctional metallophosphatase/5'-nucleotidase [Rhodoferax sp.]